MEEGLQGSEISSSFSLGSRRDGPRPQVRKLRLEQRPQALGDLEGEPGVPPPAQEVVQDEEGEADGAVDLGLGRLCGWWRWLVGWLVGGRKRRRKRGRERKKKG